jgi:hypothetical protein
VSTFYGSAPVFVNLLRSPGIDSKLAGPVRQPYLKNRPAGLHRLAESILGIDSWASKTFTNTGPILHLQAECSFVFLILYDMTIFTRSALSRQDVFRLSPNRHGKFPNALHSHPSSQSTINLSREDYSWGGEGIFPRSRGSIHRHLRKRLTVVKTFSKTRGLKRNVVYLCWPIAPSYSSPNAGVWGEGGGDCGVSANEYFGVLWRSTSIFILWVRRRKKIDYLGSSQLNKKRCIKQIFIMTDFLLISPT